MNSVKITKVAPENLEQLQNISMQTFSEAFAEVNTEDDMAMYLAESFSLEKLKTELLNPSSQFYFALHESKVIGYLKLNTEQAQTDIKDNHALEIERIYVLQEFLGKQVGQSLYNKAIEIAQEMNIKYVWLGVWENNLRAINFYKRNGFIAFDKHFFMLGTDQQTDIMMKRTLLH